MFKEYYEDIYSGARIAPTGDIFSIRIPGSICYALGKATQVNRGALVNNILDVKALHDKGMNLFYIPIDTYDFREGLSVYEARLLAESIHKVIDEDIELRCMVTNGCINDHRLNSKRQWLDLWSSLGNHISSISVGGSFWLNKTSELPDFVSDIRIGRFMLFGFVPYCDDVIGKNSLVLEGTVLGVYPDRARVIIDLGDAYCDPSQCVPYDLGLKLDSSSSNYAVFTYPSVGKYYIGQKVLFTPNYRHSSALARLDVHYDYE